MHAIADGAPAGTRLCPITAERAARLSDAPGRGHLAASAAAARRVDRRPAPVHADGRIMVNRQLIRLGPRHADKLVTGLIADTCCRILHGEEELAIKHRRDTTPVTGAPRPGKGTQPS
jgi:hypothetical protein